MAVLILCTTEQQSEQEYQEVLAYLNKAEAEPFVLNLDRFYLDYDVHIDLLNRQFRLSNRVTQQTVKSGALRSVWFCSSAIDSSSFEVDRPALKAHLYSEYQATLDALTVVLEACDVELVSSPFVLGKVSAKPQQQLFALELGFQLPRQIISSSAKSFLEQDWSTDAVIKLVDSHKAMEGDAQPPLVQPVSKALYTGIESGDIELEVHYFQERLQQVAEYRVVAFGQEAYAFKITGDYEVDWRGDLSRIAFSYEADHPLEKDCLAYLRKTGLNFGSFDFMETAEGYYFIECNSPGYFLFCDAANTLRLAERFGRYLAEGA